MKIALSSEGNTLESPFSLRFARAPYFVFIDSETRSWEAVANPAANARGGAGPMAIQFLNEHGAQVLISGNYGPNAYAALAAAGMQAFLSGEGTVNEVFQRYLDGKLQQAAGATRDEGHHEHGAH